MADPTIPEMVERVAKRLGDTFVPDNPYSLRDLLIHTIINVNGPTTAEHRVYREHTIDRWLIAFAEEALAAMREPTEAMIEAGILSVRGVKTLGWEDDMRRVFPAMIDAAIGR